jgi:hypothetical protein
MFGEVLEAQRESGPEVPGAKVSNFKEHNVVESRFDIV